MSQPVNTLIKADWIVTVDDNSPEDYLVDHALVIDQGNIVDILPAAAAEEKYQPDKRHDLPGHVLIPGLINSHTHAAMTLFRGLADDLPLMQWLNEHIWPAEAHWVNEAFVRDGSRLAIAEMMRGGTTCFNDMYFFPEITARVADDMHMRATVGMIIIDFPSNWATTETDYFDKGLQLHDGFRDHPLIQTAFAPHAPYSVSDRPLQKIQTLANELDVQVHMHVHETADEVRMGQEQYASRPLARLQQLGMLSPSLLAVHMTQLEDDEIAAFARSGAHVVHCPQSNLKLASGFCPVKKLLDAGINVCLGTDSAASNNNLDMFAEMQTAALLAKGLAGDATALPALQALQMATINGARALGIDQQTGSLSIGKSADVVAVNLGQLHSQPVFNPVSQLVYASQSSDVSDVWIAGRQRLDNGRLCGVDTTELFDNANFWRDKLTQTPTAGTAHE